MIIALMLLLPTYTFASGSQKQLKCLKGDDLVLKIKPRPEEDTHVEFFENGELVDLQICDLFPQNSRTKKVTCTVIEEEGVKTVIDVVAVRGKRNKSTFKKTFVTPEGEEVLEDFNMTCRRL